MSQFKLVLLGDTSTGKSSVAVRFVRDEFFEFSEPTIGAAFLTQTVTLDDTQIKYEIWDTAGQERYRSLAPMYYRGASAAVIVYDITNQESFAGAKSWIKELQRRGDPNVVIALCGNKVDIEANRAVDAEEVEAFATEQGIIFKETSAKTGQNVKELFVDIARKLPKNAQVDEEQSFPISESEEQKRACC